MTEPDRSFRRQVAIEVEGAAAGLAGKQRTDCPYNKNTQSFEWNHWVFGCEIAASEARTIASGEVFFSSTSHMNPMIPGTGVPVKDAIRRGLWTPRFASVPSS